MCERSETYSGTTYDQVFEFFHQKNTCNFTFASSKKIEKKIEIIFCVISLEIKYNK